MIVDYKAFCVRPLLVTFLVKDNANAIMKTLAFACVFCDILKGNVLQKRTLSKEIRPSATCDERHHWRNGKYWTPLIGLAHGCLAN